MMMLGITLATVGLFWAVHQSDRLSVERQIRTTQHAIEAMIQQFVRQQEIVAVSDEAARRFEERTLDLQWIDHNIGLWLNRTFLHDRVYVLDPQGQPLYAMVDGTRQRTSAYEPVAPVVTPIVEQLINVHRMDHGHRARPVAVLNPERTRYHAHLVNMFGRPAVVGAMKIMPQTNAVRSTQSGEFLLLSIRLIDKELIQQLSRRNLIDNLRYSPIANPAPGEEVLPLKDDGAGTIGYFIWRPELPGTQILRTLGPATALALFLIVGLTSILVWSLRRSTLQLEKTVLELQASEAHAQHLAFHDTLTGLPNRALFNDRLDQALALTRRGKKLALITIDLNRFKNVNDTLGHHVGDSVISEVARRLSHLIRSTDVVSRIGGDEFAVIQFGIGKREDVESLCRRIIAVLGEPFHVLGRQTFIGASIGVALAPDAATDRTELMRRSDIALYLAKNEGDTYRFFTEAMDEVVKLRGSIEEELRSALATGDGLEVHYQPQISAAEQRIIGVEALLRWRHPSGVFIPPSQFIPIAEESGLIGQLGDWVLRQACAASHSWPDLFIGVNLSPLQFRAHDFADRVIKTVQDCDADPTRIELEVTESVLLEDEELCRTAFRKLRNAGFRIALDDFGTGYSSLSYLRRFEFDKIKIDRSFVQHLGHAADSPAIVTAIANLGRAMDLTVTAEGVETEAQKRFLTRAGCTVLQGFFFARALPFPEMAAVLSSKKGSIQTGRLTRTGPQRAAAPKPRRAAIS